MGPGGGLHELGIKIDTVKLDVTRALAKGAVVVSLLTIAIPVAMALWSNSRANDRLQKQVDIAADVAKHLKEFQDAAESGPLGESRVAGPSQFAQISPIK
jgi:hypothetical protein